MITNNFDTAWIELHKNITELEANTNDTIIQEHIYSIDRVLKDLETYLDKEYHWKFRN